MYLHVQDHVFEPRDLEYLREFALCTRSVKNYNGYRKIALSKLSEDETLARVIARASTLVPEDATFDQGWFMVYDSVCSGIPVHADYAYITVNIWITANECICDSKQNGMSVWELQSPPDWNFEKFNGDAEAIHALIKEHKPKRNEIDYAFNRVIVFRSNMFHETDGVSTIPGPLNRRVNLGLMFKKMNVKM